MKFRTLFFAAVSILFFPFSTVQAFEWNDSIEYRAEIGGSLSDGQHTPFWMNANRFGFSGIERNNFWLRAGVFKHEDRSSRFSWGAGVDLGVAHRMQSTFIPQQLYAEVRYRCLDAMIGAKELSDGFLDQSLSSGSLTQGWNARPLPQIRIGIFDYANVWGCKDMFAVKGHIAYGVFDDNWWINRWANPSYYYSLNTLYCSRAIYFRGGNEEKFPLTGELGLVMDTEFGGKTWVPGSKDEAGHWEKHPTYLKAWAKALIPMAGGDDTSIGEQTNVEGNFLGNWSFSLKWQDPRGWMVRLYYQHFYEDHSMLFFDYPWIDGLYGVQGKLPENPFVSDILYEFLYMKDQAGPVYWDHNSTIDYQISARDSYYNHYIYNGWQNWGQAIGNPLMISPIYNENHFMHFYHNRIVSHHFAFKGHPSPQTDYRVLLTYLRSWGTYLNPLPSPKTNFSWLAEVNYHPKSLEGWNASISLAMDHGSLLGNSFGAMLSISKTGWIK
ncbi:MAG: capsule assembly Wzi family protein [Bacteroides sp.]|nr:capsule assembly Wzi family protein [Bacteroidales bacterium]MBD5302920.1 capsule assembly Wzi family protein [Bacteroides sp.]